MVRHIAQGGTALSIPLGPTGDPGLVRANGEYDFIVCALCEESFGQSEDRFKDFFENASPVRGPGDSWCYPGWRPEPLQRFFLTCVLRAHLSTRPMFQAMSLGSRYEPLRAALHNPPAGMIPEFDVVLLRNTHVFSRSIGYPAMAPIAAIATVRIPVPGFDAVVQTDVRPLPLGLDALALGRTNPPVMALEQKHPHRSFAKGLLTAKERHGPRIDRMAAVLGAAPPDLDRDGRS